MRGSQPVYKVWPEQPATQNHKMSKTKSSRNRHARHWRGTLPTTTRNLYLRTSRRTWTGGGRTARQARTDTPQPVHQRGSCHAPRWGRCGQERPAAAREDRPRWGRKDRVHLAAVRAGNRYDLYRTRCGEKSNKFRHTWPDRGTPQS